MAHVQAMVDRVSDHFGRIDILVNNAGTGNAYSFEAMDDDLLSEDLQLKLYGAVHCTRAVLPALKERGGVIINITTPAGKAAPGASVPTSLARAAGIALTKALANEYAGAGIRVNGVRKQHPQPPERPPLAEPARGRPLLHAGAVLSGRWQAHPARTHRSGRGSWRRDRVSGLHPRRLRHRLRHQRRRRLRPHGVTQNATRR